MMEIIDNLDEAIVKLVGTKIVKVNKSAEKYGFDIGKEILEVFSSPYMDKIMSKILDNEEFEMENKVYFFEYGHRYVKLIYKSGYLVIKDITDYRNLQEAKKDFVISLSHELFNPITALKGSVALLKETTLSKETSEIVDSLEITVKRIERIVRQLKMVAMAQLGLYEVRKTIVDPKKVLREVLVDLKDKINAKKIRISERIETDGVETDPFVFYVITKNLVSNAVKYSYPNSQVKVIITSNELIVEDQGIGIRKEEKERIFNRFYRGKEAVKMAPGSGLGLSVVKHLCNLMNYKLLFESTWLVGSKFIVKFTQ